MRQSSAICESRPRLLYQNGTAWLMQLEWAAAYLGHLLFGTLNIQSDTPVGYT